MGTPDAFTVLREMVEAHNVVHPNTQQREPILYLRYLGGARLQHHGFPDGEVPEVDEALLEEMHAQGMVSIDYRDSSWLITPTAEARQLVARLARLEDIEPVADVAPIVAAVEQQAGMLEPLSWPAVRPVLLALRKYWEAGGYSVDGLALAAILEGMPKEREGLFIATLRELLDSEYVVCTSPLMMNSGAPAEVAFTDRTRTALAGWPGAEPRELVENLLAVLLAEAEGESDEPRKRRLLRVAETIRELGVGTASDILARVITGTA